MYRNIFKSNKKRGKTNVFPFFSFTRSNQKTDYIPIPPIPGIPPISDLNLDTDFKTKYTTFLTTLRSSFGTSFEVF